jgi:hypothetical protein
VCCDPLSNQPCAHSPLRLLLEQHCFTLLKLAGQHTPSPPRIPRLPIKACLLAPPLPPSLNALQAYDSPLAVTLAAGSVALPALLKLAGVMEKGGQELASCDQLPIEIELGQEFVYHSIFACPVSRDQSRAGGLGQGAWGCRWGSRGWGERGQAFWCELECNQIVSVCGSVIGHKSGRWSGVDVATN